MLDRDEIGTMAPLTKVFLFTKSLLAAFWMN